MNCSSSCHLPDEEVEQGEPQTVFQPQDLLNPGKGRTCQGPATRLRLILWAHSAAAKWLLKSCLGHDPVRHKPTPALTALGAPPHPSFLLTQGCLVHIPVSSALITPLPCITGTPSGCWLCKLLGTASQPQGPTLALLSSGLTWAHTSRLAPSALEVLSPSPPFPPLWAMLFHSPQDWPQVLQVWAYRCPCLRGLPAGQSLFPPVPGPLQHLPQ